MTWWHYLLLANVYLTLFFVFYTIFLRKETFFNMNRIYLVSSALLSFFIPVIQSDWIKTLFITHKVQETIYQVSPAMMYQFNATAIAAPQQQLTIGQILCAIYLTGMLILIGRFFYQLIILNWLIHQRVSETTFSFFNNIRIEQHDADNKIINAHEEAHARQWHSADIILLEAIMIINWFNPVVYFYRTAVKHIHEFIADRDVLKTGTDRAEYAMLLLSQTFTAPPYYLVNPFFNHSLLKQRILMLQKNKSQRIKLIKYGLSAPLFALMLILSSATVNESNAIKTINNKAGQVFSAPAGFNGQAGGSDSHIVNVDESGVDHLSEADKKDLYAVIKQHTQSVATPPVAEHQAAALRKPDNSEIFTSVEQNAEFPGGIQSFFKYLTNNIRYPAEARQKNIQGKVFATFVVEKDGAITGIKILRGIGGGADEETTRLLEAMPKWNPGVQNGNKVRQQYTVPINFSLTDNQAKTEPDDLKEDVFTQVEQAASFPGGIQAFYRFLSQSIHYPNEAREKKIQGKVFIGFVVEKDGSLTNLHVMRDAGSGLGDEALRVMKLSPKWTPGMQNGQPVRELYTVPVSFSLVDGNIDNKKDSIAKGTIAQTPLNAPATTVRYRLSNSKFGRVSL